VLRPVTGTGTRVKPRGLGTSTLYLWCTSTWQGEQHLSQPGEAPMQGLRRRPNPPDSYQRSEIMQKVVACFSSAVRAIQQLLWTMSCDHSQEVQGTNKHANMLASRQHMKLIFRACQQSVYCACKGGLLGAEAREPVSKGQICNRPGCAHGAKSFVQVVCTIKQGCAI
jgi:hypothetical protein